MGGVTQSGAIQWLKGHEDGCLAGCPGPRTGVLNRPAHQGYRLQSEPWCSGSNPTREEEEEEEAPKTEEIASVLYFFDSNYAGRKSFITPRLSRSFDRSDESNKINKCSEHPIGLQK